MRTQGGHLVAHLDLKDELVSRLGSLAEELGERNAQTDPVPYPAQGRIRQFLQGNPFFLPGTKRIHQKGFAKAIIVAHRGVDHEGFARGGVPARGGGGLENDLRHPVGNDLNLLLTLDAVLESVCLLPHVGKGIAEGLGGIGLEGSGFSILTDLGRDGFSTEGDVQVGNGGGAGQGPPDAGTGRNREIKSFRGGGRATQVIGEGQARDNGGKGGRG